MKRDMDLIRRMLLEVEGDDNPKTITQFTEAHEVYNIALLEDAGLVEARVVKGSMGKPISAFVIRLTWQGHDFLDAAKDDTIWAKARDRILKPGISFTFSILVEFLKQEAKQRLGLLAASSS